MPPPARSASPPVARTLGPTRPSEVVRVRAAGWAEGCADSSGIGTRDAFGGEVVVSVNRGTPGGKSNSRSPELL